MPLFMSTSCLLNTTAVVSSQCIPKHHPSQMMAEPQGGIPVQLFWTPQSLQKAKQGESDHGTKYGVLVLKYIQSWIWPLCVAIASCQSVILALPAAANNFGWHSLDGLEDVWCCICVGRQQLLNLTNTAACNFATVNIQWTTPGLQKLHFILLYDEQQIHRPHLLLPRTSDTAILGKVTYFHTRAKHVFMTFVKFLISPSFLAQLWKITTQDNINLICFSF